MCSLVEPVVNGLEEDLGQRMKFVIADHAAGDAPTRIARYGLDVHGMVVTDQDDTVLWKESGHAQQREAVKAALLGLLDE